MADAEHGPYTLYADIDIPGFPPAWSGSGVAERVGAAAALSAGKHEFPVIEALEEEK